MSSKTARKTGSLKRFSREVKNVSYQLNPDFNLASLIQRQKGDDAMCGIVGLFLKDPKLESQLGSLLADMLITMTDRGPDSAGIAIYSATKKDRA